MIASEQKNRVVRKESEPMDEKTYHIVDVHGNEVEISAKTAMELFDTLEREHLKEEVLFELEALCKSEGIDIKNISDVSINAIVDTYASYRNEDNDGHELTAAVDKHFDAIFEEARLAGKPKTAERE